MEQLGVDEVYIDRMSGKNTNRPELQRMMEYVRRGDTVIVESISRFARNTRDLLELVEKLSAKGVEFVSKKEAIDTTTPTGKFIYDDPDLTIDPKRYSKKVVDLRSKLKTQPYVLLGDVVDFIPEKQNAYGKKITVQKSSIYQYVEIQDIGFGDFHCKEMRGWELPSRAKHFSSAGDIYIGAIWGSAIKWCYIPEGIDNVVVTNGCFRCRVKAGMEKFTPDLLAYLNSEGWGVQMRAFSRGSDGLAEICEDDAKNVIIPLLSDDVRDGLSEYVENLQRGTTTINSVVKQLIKDERIAYNDPDKRPSHIVIV